MILSREEIYQKVKVTISEVLTCERRGVDILSTSTLQGDLGVKSINFLDIVFRLEQRFYIKISHGELFAQDPESVVIDPTVGAIAKYVEGKLLAKL